MDIRRGWWIRYGISMMVPIAFVGCARDSYHFGIQNSELKSALPNTPNLITVGGASPRLDKFEYALGFPKRLGARLLPKRIKIETPEAIQADRMAAVQTATNYLDENELRGVYVDVHEYNPSQQWYRLKNNQRIAPFWKYTVGSIYYMGYCILPGRALGFDHYNTFTNTLSINSRSSAGALLQAGYVKDIYNRRYPGTYMVASHLPIVPLVRDVRVTGDVLTYARVDHRWPLERDLYPFMYAQLGASAVEQATLFIPGSSSLPFYFIPALTGAGGAAGAGAGTLIAKQRESQALTEQKIDEMRRTADQSASPSIDIPMQR